MDSPTTSSEGRRQTWPAAAASGGMDMAKLTPTLPLETRCPPFPLRQLAGFWLPEMILPGVAAAHARFEPRPDDVFLASFPKSGTTCLKALAFATLHRAEHPPPPPARDDDPGHPLRLRSPHDCVPFFELPLALAAGAGAGGEVEEDVFAALPSPRLLATHLPYSLLPERVAATCRVVYVCRDPKDALVSAWLFTKKHTAATISAAGEDDNDVPPPYAYPVQDALELFCEGRCVGGPQWLHVLGYWEESRRRPDKVLFLRYEEMLRDPASSVRPVPEGWAVCATTKGL